MRMCKPGCQSVIPINQHPRTLQICTGLYSLYLFDELFLFLLSPLKIRIPTVYPLVCRNRSIQIRILRGIERAILRNFGLSWFIVRQRRRRARRKSSIARRLRLVTLRTSGGRLDFLNGHFVQQLALVPWYESVFSFFLSPLAGKKVKETTTAGKSSLLHGYIYLERPNARRTHAIRIHYYLHHAMLRSGFRQPIIRIHLSIASSSIPCG